MAKDDFVSHASLIIFETKTGCRRRREYLHIVPATNVFVKLCTRKSDIGPLTEYDI